MQNMAMSKNSITAKHNADKARLEDLEKRAKDDPLKRDWRLWEEIEKLKKKMA
jgi:hypothetical protein